MNNKESISLPVTTAEADDAQIVWAWLTQQESVSSSTSSFGEVLKSIRRILAALTRPKE